MDINYIKSLAASAKLKYTEADIADWKEKLEGVFAWIDKLDAVDTSSVHELNEGEALTLREDVVVPFDGMDKLIADFKESESNMAKVKKML